jgi:hypothetical protein
MKNRKCFLIATIASIGMAVLILDAKTALSGAAEGISLCIYTVIPSLLPFFLLSILLNNTLLGVKLAILRPFGKLTGIPSGAENLLLIGLIGGYPVGAQCIANAYRDRRISKSDAHLMLGFCSNAGPAFISGIGSCIFQRIEILWFLWGVHVLSALLVGVILPAKSNSVCTPASTKTITIAVALEKSIRILASVCGWIIIFRVIMAFLSRWCLWLFDETAQSFVLGLLELSNGCCRLSAISSTGARFVLFSMFLGFGGICVLMQTYSVTDGLGLGMYFLGKVMQCTLSLLIAGLLQSFLFVKSERWNDLYLYGLFAITAVVVTAVIMRTKKRVEIFC